jgi:hypothetical protein
MKVTEEQRSMIASAFVGAFTCQEGDSARSLCCASDKLEVCAAIVGDEEADSLVDYCYENLGCFGFPSNPEYHADVEQLFLDKISNLEEL